MINVKLKKLHENAIVPSHSYSELEAGYDLYSVENFIIKAGQRHGFATGIAMQIEDGHVGLIWDRSGLSSKFGLKVLGGVIDCTYRGEIIVNLVNTGEEDYAIRKGDRIAQIIFQKCENANIQIVDELEKSQRDKGGFGSTGR